VVQSVRWVTARNRFHRGATGATAVNPSLINPLIYKSNFRSFGSPTYNAPVSISKSFVILTSLVLLYALASFVVAVPECAVFCRGGLLWHLGNEWEARKAKASSPNGPATNSPTQSCICKSAEIDGTIAGGNDRNLRVRAGSACGGLISQHAAPNSRFRLSG